MLKTPTVKSPGVPGGMGLIPGWKTKIPQSPVAQPKETKTKTKSTNIILDFCNIIIACRGRHFIMILLIKLPQL